MTGVPTCFGSPAARFWGWTSGPHSVSKNLKTRQTHAQAGPGVLGRFQAPSGYHPPSEGGWWSVHSPPPLLRSRLPTVAPLAHRAEVAVVIRPAFLEGHEVVDMGFPSADGPAALAAPHGITQQDPRPSGSPVRGLVVGCLLRRPGRHLHPLRPPRWDFPWHHDTNSIGNGGGNRDSASPHGITSTLAPRTALSA